MASLLLVPKEEENAATPAIFDGGEDGNSYTTRHYFEDRYLFDIVGNERKKALVDLFSLFHRCFRKRPSTIAPERKNMLPMLFMRHYLTLLLSPPDENKTFDYCREVFRFTPTKTLQIALDISQLPCFIDRVDPDVVTNIQHVESWYRGTLIAPKRESDIKSEER